MEIKKLENILQELHLALVNHECNERDIFAVNETMQKLKVQSELFSLRDRMLKSQEGEQ